MVRLRCGAAASLGSGLWLEASVGTSRDVAIKGIHNSATNTHQSLDADATLVLTVHRSSDGSTQTMRHPCLT